MLTETAGIVPRRFRDHKARINSLRGFACVFLDHCAQIADFEDSIGLEGFWGDVLLPKDVHWEPPAIMPIDEQDKGNAARSEEQNSILSSDVGTVKLLILSTVLLCNRLIKRTQCLCSAFHDSTLSGNYLSWQANVFNQPLISELTVPAIIVLSLCSKSLNLSTVKSCIWCRAISAVRQCLL